MTIHDSWQDRERERKRIYAQFRGLSPAQQLAMWDMHCQQVIADEMGRGKLFVAASPGPLVWTRPQPERWGDMATPATASPARPASPP